MGICAIWGPPQSGKTTLAVNLAYAISRGDKSVCLISPKTFSELSMLLGVRITEEHSLRTALQCRESVQQTAFRVDDLFFVLTAPVTGDILDDNYSGEQVKSLLEQARITYDLVIVDCPSGPTNLLAAWSLNKAGTVIMTFGGRLSCAMWYNANKRALAATRRKAVYVASQVTTDFDLDAMFKYLECAPEIRFPCIPDAALRQNESRLLFGLPGKTGRAYSRAINKLCEVITR